MSISEIIKNRNITEILHFTTNQGLLGILDSKAALSRERLGSNDRLDFILKLNSELRKDTPWLDYVNLSISEINNHFFKISSGKWHSGSDIWWCILSFDPSILEHEGVHFTTTNNIYTGVIREQGCTGLERLFCKKVIRWDGNFTLRSDGIPSNQTTCNQAEVLYPSFVSTDFLKTIYVAREEDIHQVQVQISAVDHKNVNIIYDKSKFSGIV